MTSAEARKVSAYLREKSAPFITPSRPNVPTLPNGVRLEIVKKLERIATRKRAGTRKSEHDLIAADFDREDLQRLYAQFRVGMFASRIDPALSADLKHFANRCWIALNRRPGPQPKYGVRLDEALARLRKNVVDYDTDPRQLKRVQKEKRARDRQLEIRRQEEDAKRTKAIEYLEGIGLDGAILRSQNSP